MSTGKGSEYPVVIGQSGPINGMRWNIRDTLLVGRDPECDVVIADRQVSRFHTRYTSTDSGVLVEDLGSKNGTFLNGKAILEPTSLEDGDMVQIAFVQNMVYLSSDATMPMEPGKPALIPQSIGLSINQKSRRVWVGSKEVIPHLSVPQYRLLEALYQQMGKVVSRDELIRIVWEDEESTGVTEQALDALVRRLRERLRKIDPNHNYITTIRGHGLRLDNA